MWSADDDLINDIAFMIYDGSETTVERALSGSRYLRQGESG